MMKNKKKNLGFWQRGVASLLLLFITVFFIFLPGCSHSDGETNENAGKKKSGEGAPLVQDSPGEVPLSGSWHKVKKGDLNKKVNSIGEFIALQTAQLGARVTGQVEEVYVDVGRVVAKGDKLLKIDPTFLSLEVDQKKKSLETLKVQLESLKQTVITGEAQVELVQANLDDSRLEYQRMKNLWEAPKGEGSSIPKKRYDDARFQFLRSQAQLKIARSQVEEIRQKQKELQARIEEAKIALKYSQEKLEETLVVAPYGGVITNRIVDPGEPARENPVTRLIEIQQTNKLKLEFSLPQRYLEDVKKGTAIEFSADGVSLTGQKGEVDLVYPFIDRETRTFRCRALIANPKKGNHFLFRPGMLVKVQVILLARKDVLLLPQKALQKTAKGYRVIIKSTGKTLPREVQIGMGTGGMVEVSGGLKEGDEVLIRSDEK